MRLCTSTVEAGKYFLTIWASDAMDLSRHTGFFHVSFVNEAFERSPLTDGVGRRGCLKRGGKEAFLLSSSPKAPDLNSLGTRSP